MAAVREVRKKSINSDKVREMVKLTEYRKWGTCNRRLDQNAERSSMFHHMG